MKSNNTPHPRLWLGGLGLAVAVLLVIIGQLVLNRTPEYCSALSREDYRSLRTQHDEYYSSMPVTFRELYSSLLRLRKQGTIRWLSRADDMVRFELASESTIPNLGFQVMALTNDGDSAVNCFNDQLKEIHLQVTSSGKVMKTSELQDPAVMHAVLDGLLELNPAGIIPTRALDAGTKARMAEDWSVRSAQLIQSKGAMLVSGTSTIDEARLIGYQVFSEDEYLIWFYLRQHESPHEAGTPTEQLQ